MANKKGSEKIYLPVKATINATRIEIQMIDFLKI
jgi:hypothetical protein